MLKIRMQGTLKDIRWFKGLMERHGEIKVKDVSKPFKNKGTDQYVRPGGIHFPLRNGDDPEGF